MPSRILGISAFYHDSAAALIEDDRIVAAAQEERFTRVKHDASFPQNAIQFCLSAANVSFADVDTVVFYEAPDLKRERQIQALLDSAPRSLRSFRQFGRRALLRRDSPLKEIESRIAAMGGGGKMPRVVPGHHHTSHAASAFYPSPFLHAAIVVVDGVGEWDTSTISVGRGSKIERLNNIAFPHSLGLLYSAFTSYCGFKVNDGEYKLMGLAPYGVPRFADRIRDHLLDIKADGSFSLNLEYFDFLTGNRMHGAGFEKLFEGPSRARTDQITQRHMDVAASVQAVLEDVMLRLVRFATERAGSRNLCLAGGVALNCVANGKILRSGLIDRLWVQPAAGDAGGALGCALQHYYGTAGSERVIRQPDSMSGSRLGPTFTQSAIEQALTTLGAIYTVADETEVLDMTARSLADGQIVGWFDGAMEFGPRALGGRSILGDPRRADMQRVLNLKVKFRESFRPFAPIVLAEEAHTWFEIAQDSPYMLIVAPVLEQHRTALSPEDAARRGFDALGVVRSVIPAVTHVDYSARIQTVDQTRNPRLHQLLSNFHRLTGVPILVNTSFNVNDEPIVCTPEDAYRCLVNTEIDKLVIGRCILDRTAQPPDARQRAARGSVAPADAEVPSDFLYTLV